VIVAQVTKNVRLALAGKQKPGQLPDHVDAAAIVDPNSTLNQRQRYFGTIRSSLLELQNPQELMLGKEVPRVK
jgi:hypothetical protein